MTRSSLSCLALVLTSALSLSARAQGSMVGVPRYSPWGAPSVRSGGNEALTGGRTHFNQSCGAACAAPINPSTGELLAPTAHVGAVAEHVTQAVEVLQGFITVSKFLDEAEQGAVEDIVKTCVREANRAVDDRLFGKDRSLPDSECGKAPTVDQTLAPTWRRYLGILKHAEAFSCIQTRLAEKFPEQFSIEPRYRKDELTGELLLTDRRQGSLRPDLVIHFTRNATRIQCIYELKFPCGYDVGNPWSEEVLAQMTAYAELGGQCRPALVTPQLGVDRH